MNVPIYQKLEIAFWDVVIDFLTQSKTVRFFIRKYIEARRSRFFKLYLSLVVVGGLFGFLVGFGLPLLVMSLR